MKLLKELGITEVQLKRILAGRRRKPAIIHEHITDEEYEFGIISDTHICSRYECLDELHTFYAICEKIGITKVLHAGDLIDGGMSHPGWENEIHTFGADRQVRYLIKNYPKVGGITTYFITGSHDYSFWKRAGVDVGELIMDQRNDLLYAGMTQGDIELGKIKIRLIHPAGGMPYARSYRGQKIVESIAPGNKPDVLAVGHLHASYYFHYRNVHVLGAGAFQRQTPYLMEKSLMPDIGGWTIKIRLDKDGSIVAFQPSWIPFYIGGSS